MIAIQQLITEHIDIWTAADTEKKSGRGRASGSAGKVYGIQKLRELILELAVRGKLVPQDANDEPASGLLKSIQAQKSKSLAIIGVAGKPFDLPIGWEWVCFGEIVQHNSGKTLDKGRNKGVLRDYITTSNLYWGQFELDSVKQMPIEESELERCTAKKGDLLICEGGEAGRAAVWNFDKDVCFQNHVHRARLYGGINPFYAYRYFEKLNASGEIEQYRKGVGISNMSGKALASVIFPLPPLLEQHRIVAKVDELMALCDQLEAQHSNAAEAHEKLVSHLLGTLTQSQNADDFNANWQRISAYFDTLFTTEASIEALKQTLLQLAVMGKLVPQDPNDEPASELLKRIQAEKAQLIAEGKLKKEKPLVPVSEDEKPFKLPVGWEWVHLPDVTDYKVGKTPSTKSSVYWTNEASGYNWVSIADLNHDGVVTETTKKVTQQALDEIFKSEPVPTGSILMSFKLTLGKISLLEVPAFHNEAIISIFPSKAIDKKYLFKVLPTRANEGDSKSAVKGNTLNSESIAALLLPLPPLAEQHRIVAKVDELLALCDQLKTRISESNQLQQKLADVLVAQSVAG